MLGILSFVFCLGPFAAIPAIVLGIMGNREIAKSHGAVGGGALSVTGIALGIANLLGSVALFVAFLVGVSTSSKHHPPPLSPVTIPTTAPTAHSRCRRWIREWEAIRKIKAGR